MEDLKPILYRKVIHAKKKKLFLYRDKIRKLFIYKILYIVFFLFLLVLQNETNKIKKIKSLYNKLKMNEKDKDKVIDKVRDDAKFEDEDKFEKNDFRVLIYSCTDELYSHYLPIFINTLLRADKLKVIDIEICTNLDKFSEDEENALDYLRKTFYFSKIKIDYNAFTKNQTGIFYNNIKLKELNTVRFVSQPTIRNKYVYIIDVDIFFFVDNFYLELIDDMNRRSLPYSNFVRKNTKRLSGLHFSEYDSYYPVPILKNYNLYDEEILYDIVRSKGIKIDHKTKYRPVFGIHASPNRPNVFASDFPDWGAANYKFNWIKYCKSTDFKFIYPLLNSFIKEKISMLNEYYGINDIEFNRMINTQYMK